MNVTAFIFPGQGSQYIGMGRDLYDSSRAAKEIFDRADEALGFSLSKLIFEGEAEELVRTVNAQPALLTMSMAVLAAADELKPQALGEPAAAAGHSLGEYSALTAAGALELEDAVRLSRRRGELMQKAGDDHPGSMAAVIGLDTEKVEDVARAYSVSVANYNCPGQIILSGEKEKLDKACTAATDAGALFTVPLQVSGAFHSPLMEDAQTGLNKELKTVEIHKPAFPIIGNTTAKILEPTAEAIRKELMTQLCHSVQWIGTLNTMRELGADTFIEIGPGNVLTKLVRRTLPEAHTITIGSMKDLEAL